jgi:hypothetical protein
MRAVIAVIQPQPMPVHSRRVVALVLDVDDDLRTLLDLEHGPRDRAVVGQHPHLSSGQLLDHWGNAQVELVAIAELDQLRGVGLGKSSNLGRKVL